MPLENWKKETLENLIHYLGTPVGRFYYSDSIDFYIQTGDLQLRVILEKVLLSDVEQFMSRDIVRYVEQFGFENSTYEFLTIEEYLNAEVNTLNFNIYFSVRPVEFNILSTNYSSTKLLVKNKKLNYDYFDYWS